MSRIIELKWSCAECDTTGILGRHKTCPSCGSPREKGEMDMSGLGSSDYAGGRNVAKTVTDAKLLDLATAGADWFCTHCTSGNRGDGDSCSNCGAPRYAKEEEDHPDFAGDHRRIKGWDARLREEIEADDSPEPKRDPRWEIVGEKGDRNGPVYLDDEVETYLPQARSRRERTLKVAGACALTFAVLLIGFLYWAFSTHEVEGTVAQMTWKQTTYVQHWTQVTERHWEDETRQRQEIEPRNGSGEQAGMTLIGGCSEEHHHDEEYQCGTRQEDYDCSYNEDYQGTCTKSEEYACGETCRDNGNGFAACSTKYCSRSVDYSCTKSRRVSKTCDRTVPKYCDRPIYETKCNYQTQEWQTTKTVPASGVGRDTKWPDPPTGRLDRQRFAADYSVLIAYEDDGPQEYALKPGDTKFLGLRTKTLKAKQAKKAEAAYLGWKVGEAVTMKVNNLGGVHSVTHGGIEVTAEEEE